MNWKADDIRSVVFTCDSISEVGVAWKVMCLATAWMNEMGIPHIHEYGMDGEGWNVWVHMPTAAPLFTKVFDTELSELEELALRPPSLPNGEPILCEFSGHWSYPLSHSLESRQAGVLRAFSKEYGPTVPSRRKR